MDEEIFEIAKENDLSLEEAEDLQELKDETGLDDEEALEVWQNL
jgi:type III secretion system FlhB-like substrate exporter